MHTNIPLPDLAKDRSAGADVTGMKSWLIQILPGVLWGFREQDPNFRGHETTAPLISRHDGDWGGTCGVLDSGNHIVGSLKFTSGSEDMLIEYFPS